MSALLIESVTILVPRTGLRELPLPDGGVTVYDDSGPHAGPGTHEAPAAFVMNDSAAAVWARLDGRRSVGDLVADLEQEHPGVDLADDVLGVLTAMDEAGLVERA